jgi:pseudaminic acid cytidylyltransferase
MSKVVAMIPARGGSKRIPGKNIKPFLGKPIITYSIETAKASGIFDQIFVYTDDDNIRDLALSKECFTVNRKYATDTETLTECVLNFIDEFKDYSNYYPAFDYLCVLLPTAVFVNGYMLGESLQELDDDLHDCIFSLVKYAHPIQRAFYLDKYCCHPKVFLQHPENEFIRTQDLSNYYYDAGQFYFLKVNKFLEEKRIFMKNSGPYIIDAVDIDNPEDWKKAEAFYKVIHE